MNRNIMLVGALLVAPMAKADILCDGMTTSGSPLTVQVKADSAVVTTKTWGGKSITTTIPNLNDVWDGHMTGMITGPGFSMKYENHYGCIKNVIVTTSIKRDTTNDLIEIAEFPRCRVVAESDSRCPQN